MWTPRDGATASGLLVSGFEPGCRDSVRNWYLVELIVHELRGLGVQSREHEPQVEQDKLLTVLVTCQ